MSRYDYGGSTTLEPEDEPAPVSRAPGSRGRRRRPRRRTVVTLAVVLVVIGGLLFLASLALPFLTVRTEGNQARANLAAALDALRTGDLPSAAARVEAARADVTAAQDAANGFRADVAAVLPVGGPAVSDVRNLVSALDEAVSVAEVGVQLFPEVLGDDAALVRDGVVDLSALVSVTDATDRVAAHLGRAHEDLVAITGESPLIGETITTAKDAALEQVVSLESMLDSFRPLLDAMPTLLGAEGPARYLVTVMNPSEQRASGGATLSLGQMTIDGGVIDFGDAGQTTDFTDMNEEIRWEPTPDNPWNPGGLGRLVNATLSPNWTTSGEELLRAWAATCLAHEGLCEGEPPDAVIAIDVQAIAELFRITGPLTVEGYGTLNSNNLVEKLVGSYDDFKNFEERHALNEAIIPLLRQKLLEGGKFVQKAQALVRLAEGRHVVAYFRDPAIQGLVTDLGLAGDLSTTTQDYLGVFTQNTNASKVDFWERRTVGSDVTLHADGSADVVTTVTIANDTPPYARRGQDPQRGYYTRYSFPWYIQSLPAGAEMAELTLDGAPVQYESFVERGREVVRSYFRLDPGAGATITVRYRVPAAAVPDGAGGLVYALDIDPHATVNPTPYSIVLRPPAGYREDGSDGEWTVNPDLTLLLEHETGTKLHTTVRFVPE